MHNCVTGMKGQGKRVWVMEETGAGDCGGGGKSAQRGQDESVGNSHDIRLGEGGRAETGPLRVEHGVDR